MGPASTILATSCGSSLWNSAFSARRPRWSGARETSYGRGTYRPAPVGDPSISRPLGSALRATSPEACRAIPWWTCGSPGCGTSLGSCPCGRLQPPGLWGSTRVCWLPRMPPAPQVKTKGNVPIFRCLPFPPASRKRWPLAPEWNWWSVAGTLTTLLGAGSWLGRETRSRLSLAGEAERCTALAATWTPWTGLMIWKSTKTCQMQRNRLMSHSLILYPQNTVWSAGVFFSLFLLGLAVSLCRRHGVAVYHCQTCQSSSGT